MTMSQATVVKSERVYRRLEEVALTAHVFAPQARPSPRLPAIVFFFGGGWVGGTPEQFFSQCEHLAGRGMVAVSAEYRVKARHGTTPFESVADAKAAVRWVRAQADELDIDPARVAAGGGSAGGHVAACTSLIPGYESPGEDVRISSAPDALVLFNPVVDTTAGDLAERFEGRAAELSPLHHVRGGLPPTLIFHGTEDAVVPLAQVERFCAAMWAASNRCDLMVFPGYGHGFFNRGRNDEVPFHETLQMTDRFLVDLGWLVAA